MKLNQSVLQQLGAKLKQNRVTFFWLIPTIFVLTYAIMLCVPKYYKAETQLKQETLSVFTHGTLGQVLGMESGLYKPEDAITSLVIPSVVTSFDLITELFNTPIITADQSYSGTYFEYMLLHTKKPFWKAIMTFIRTGKNPWKKVTDSDIAYVRANSIVKDPTIVNRTQERAYKMIARNIRCKADNTSDLITIVVEDQDPRVAAIIANTITNLLEQYFNDYHTRKVEESSQFYAQTIEEAYKQYEAASIALMQFERAHKSALSNAEALEHQLLADNVQNARSTIESFKHQYSIVASQLMATPKSFVLVQSAYASNHAAGPHRTITALLITLLATILAIIWIGKEEIFEELK